MSSASTRPRSANCSPTLKRDTQLRRIVRGGRFKPEMSPSTRRASIWPRSSMPAVSFARPSGARIASGLSAAYPARRCAAGRIAAAAPYVAPDSGPGGTRRRACQSRANASGFARPSIRLSEPGADSSRIGAGAVSKSFPRHWNGRTIRRMFTHQPRRDAQSAGVRSQSRRYRDPERHARSSSPNIKRVSIRRQAMPGNYGPRCSS